jgi:two-component system, OmpR family, sensor kinase
VDGHKGKLRDSLQFRLSVSVAITILVVAILSGVFAYFWAFEEAIELQDEQLIQLAALVNYQRISQPNSAAEIEISRVDPESHFVVQWLDSAPGQIRELPDLPQNLTEGLHTLVLQGMSWRLYVKKVITGQRVAVAQQTEVRDEIARTSALNVLIPLIILIPLLLAGVAYLSRQVFAPLRKMASQLDENNNNDLTPLSEEGLASEISPFVRAINRLLHRIGEFVEQQRKFSRDAAHELRSPLTAISLQAERLVELSRDSELHARLISLHKATERTRTLIEQLLVSARVQEDHQIVKEPISLKGVLRELLEDLLPLADVKVINLSVEGEDIVVLSESIDLQILIKNLVDNAIRYTPPKGTIKIFLNEDEHAAELIVKDSGPGIPVTEQMRVFDTFYRVPGNEQLGSGLGLSIVKIIAKRLGVEIDLYNNSDQVGLSVRVIFPK